MFEGNTGDPSTLAAQVAKLKQRFHLDHVVLVGDRGMITEARVETVLKPAGLDWITALRAPTIRTLLEQGAFQLSLFDERDLAEVTSADFPDDRLVVCRNPWLAAERARKRLDLLAATEADLRKVAKAVARKTKPLRGADKIGLAAGAVLNRHKVAKHFILTITDDTFGFDRNTEAIEAEGRLDGFYVIRTNLDKTTLATSDVVRVYKSLSQTERAFRSIKTVDLEIRPIHHRLSDRVRAHVLLCMLAYYLSGTCVRRWLPFCSTIISAPRLPPRDLPSSHPRSVPRPLAARPLQSARLTPREDSPDRIRLQGRLRQGGPGGRQAGDVRLSWLHPYLFALTAGQVLAGPAYAA